MLSLTVINLTYGPYVYLSTDIEIKEFDKMHLQLMLTI